MTDTPDPDPALIVLVGIAFVYLCGCIEFNLFFRFRFDLMLAVFLLANESVPPQISGSVLVMILLRRVFGRSEEAAWVGVNNANGRRLALT